MVTTNCMMKLLRWKSGPRPKTDFVGWKNRTRPGSLRTAHQDFFGKENIFHECDFQSWCQAVSKTTPKGPNSASGHRPKALAQGARIEGRAGSVLQAWVRCVFSRSDRGHWEAWTRPSNILRLPKPSSRLIPNRDRSAGDKIDWILGIGWGAGGLNHQSNWGLSCDLEGISEGPPTNCFTNGSICYIYIYLYLYMHMCISVYVYM